MLNCYDGFVNVTTIEIEVCGTITSVYFIEMRTCNILRDICQITWSHDCSIH